MADEDDYQHALSGSLDLVGCVLDGADFSGMSLQGRDFRNSKLKRAVFDSADLSSSDFRGADKAHARFRNAILIDAKIDGAIFRIDFSGSILRGAKVSGILHGCNLNNANLSGADFRAARFVEGCTFDGTLADESTLFDGTRVLRPYAREEIFRDYEFSRGILSRRKIGEGHQVEDSLARDASQALDRAIYLIKSSAGDATALLGHNNPPDEFRIIDSHIENDVALLENQSEAIKAGTAEKAGLESASDVLKKYSAMSARWVASQADIMATGFSRSFGETLGSKTALIVSALYFSDALNVAVQLMVRLSSSLAN